MLNCKNPTRTQCLLLHQNQAWQQAEEGYLKLLTKDPQDHITASLLGLLLLEQNKPQRAVVYFEQAIAVYDRDPGYFNNLAQAYLHQNELGLAERYYIRALDLEPNNTNALNNLALLYQKQKRYREALDTYIKSAHADPSNIDTHFALGILFLKLSRQEEAITQLKNVINLEPLHIKANFYLGSLYLNQDKLELAEQHLKAVLTLSPEHSEALTNLGTIRLKQNKAQHAIECFASALAYDNSNEEAQNNLAATFMAHKRFQNAIPHYEDLLANAPSNEEYLYNIGVAYMQCNLLDKAIESFTSLLKLSPEHVACHVNLGAVYSRKNNTSKTTFHLEQAVKLDPRDKASQFMLQAIKQEPTTDTPPSYVKNLFDSYAPHYEEHLLKQLNYKFPIQLKSLLESLFHNKDAHSLKILDLGAGSGLLGEHLKPLASRLDGIDISPNMLELAKQKAIYTNLYEGEIVNWLTESSNEYDLIIAGDVVPYFGDLQPLISAISMSLAPEGNLILSIEKNDEAPFTLQTSGRFSHLPGYLEEQAVANNLKLIEQQPIQLRDQHDSHISGALMVFQLC